jgi:anti-sigma B factor antagonist
MTIPSESLVTGQAEFAFEVVAEDGGVLVSIWGELDLATAAALREILVSPEVFDAPKVRVDLTGVEFLGSTGIGVLVTACKRVRALGGTFSVICGRGEPRRVLEVSGLNEYLQIGDAP